ncbi:hypothetical protein ABW19_dt0204020 [Dactylella cylindrospora]|nr:hypothetical protein ABW19_dt0204020 [Dactylella cylindrospora]
MPPRPNPSTSKEAATLSRSSTSSTTQGPLDSQTDDPKTKEFREFAVAVLESFELQAIRSFTNEESIARTRHQLLKELIGMPLDGGPPSPRWTGPATEDHDMTDDGNFGEGSSSYQARSSRTPRR